MPNYNDYYRGGQAGRKKNNTPYYVNPAPKTPFQSIDDRINQMRDRREAGYQAIDQQRGGYYMPKTGQFLPNTGYLRSSGSQSNGNRAVFGGYTPEQDQEYYLKTGRRRGNYFSRPRGPFQTYGMQQPGLAPSSYTGGYYAAEQSQTQMPLNYRPYEVHGF